MPGRHCVACACGLVFEDPRSSHAEKHFATCDREAERRKFLNRLTSGMRVRNLAPGIVQYGGSDDE